MSTPPRVDGSDDIELVDGRINAYDTRCVENVHTQSSFTPAIDAAG